MYTQRNAIQAFKNQNKPTYQNVLFQLFGEHRERDAAKTRLQELAKENGCTVSDIFNEFKEMQTAGVNELMITGYFDF